MGRRKGRVAALILRVKLQPFATLAALLEGRGSAHGEA